MQGKYYKWIVFLAFLLLLLAGSIIAGLCFGEIRFSIQDLFQLWNGDPDDVRLNILRQLRIPRIILGFIVGGALSLSGVILQGIFRNPLVEPYTLGISGGASVGVTAAIVLSLHTLYGSLILPIAGFVGALVTIVLVYTLGIRRGKVRIHNLLLTGVMISFISSSLMLLIMSVTKSENLHGIVFWIMGSLNETDPMLISLISVTSLAVLCLAFFYTPTLNAMRLGSERAIHWGSMLTGDQNTIFAQFAAHRNLCFHRRGYRFRGIDYSPIDALYHWLRLPDIAPEFLYRGRHFPDPVRYIRPNNHCSQ